jgi:transposase
LAVCGRRAGVRLFAKWTLILRDTEGTEKRSAGKRRRFTREYRREVVQETLAPGASVAGVALRHRLNANRVFTWRRKLLPNLAAVPAKSVKMLPVTITDSGATASVVIAGANAPGKPVRRSRSRGVIEIELNGARLVLKGTVDAGALRVVLEALVSR